MRVTDAFSAAALALLLLMPASAMAGADADAHDETGPRLFGFVRDTDGKALANARVTASIKAFGALVARSDATGAYRVPLPGVGGQIIPANIAVSCDKDGFKQARVVTRTPLNKKPLTALEVDCRLQAIKGK